MLAKGETLADCSISILRFHALYDFWVSKNDDLEMSNRI